MPLALVVEDDRDTLTLFREVLRLGDFTVITATAVPAALTLLEENTPDIVLVDMNMPGRLGTDVLEYVRQTPRLADTKTIVVTANPLTESDAEAIGTDLFLIKPVSIKELLTLAQRLVSEKMQRLAGETGTSRQESEGGALPDDPSSFAGHNHGDAHLRGYNLARLPAAIPIQFITLQR